MRKNTYAEFNFTTKVQWLRGRWHLIETIFPRKCARARAMSFSRRLPSSPTHLQLGCLPSVSLRNRSPYASGARAYIGARRCSAWLGANPEINICLRLGRQYQNSRFVMEQCLRSIHSLILFQSGRLSGRFASAGLIQAAIISSQSKCLSSLHQIPMHPCQWSARTRSNQPW